MKMLLSIVSLEEANIVVRYRPDILDIKNPSEGSLGAQFPWILKDISEAVKDTGILCSATLGDLPYKPGTAALAAFGAASCGVGYIKAGLFGVQTFEEAYQMMVSIVRSVRMVDSRALVVASGYADFNRFGGLPYTELVKAASQANADVVMLDTAIKDGKTLFDAMTYDEIKKFINLAKDQNLLVALAGSIKQEHLKTLVELNPDIIGIRGAVCEAGKRTNTLSSEKVEAFMNYLRISESKNHQEHRAILSHYW